MRWLVFRVLSFLIPLAFLFVSGDKTMAVVCAVVVLMWIASISMVATFIFNLSEAIEGNSNRARNTVAPAARQQSVTSALRPPRLPRSDKQTHGIRPSVQLTQEHLRQLEEFQEYVRRTSWCSWSASDDGAGGGGGGGGRASRTSFNSVSQNNAHHGRH